MLKRWALVAGYAIVAASCRGDDQANEPTTRPNRPAVTTTDISTTSTRPYEPVLLSLGPKVEVSPVDAMWFVWPWDVHRADGRITISATHATDFEQRERVSLTLADGTQPRLLDASATVINSLIQENDVVNAERTATIAASDVHLARFDPNGIISGTIRTLLGRELRFWVDIGRPFTITSIGSNESPVTMDLTDRAIVKWHELWVQLVRVDGCEIGVPSAVIHLHGIEGPWYNPADFGNRDQVLQSGASSIQAKIGFPNRSYTYDLAAEVECGSPPLVQLTAGVADWTPR